MKMLLYCCKAKPYLVDCRDLDIKNKFRLSKNKVRERPVLNGKIVAECDFEVEEINHVLYDCNNDEINDICGKITTQSELTRNSRTGLDDIVKYFWQTLEKNNFGECKLGYAIHIKNLHIFDEPKTLGNYYSQGQVDWIEETELYRLKNGITKALQNMCYAYKYSYSKAKLEKYVLISIRPEWLCKILNSEKTIEIRKKILKEML